MDIVFTTNQKFWSKALRWLLNEPTSHVALRFYVLGVHLTIDCSKEGGQLMTWYNFQKKNEIIEMISLETKHQLEAYLFRRSLSLVGVTYDLDAYKYGFYRAILKKFFEIPFPKINKWAKPENYACTEIFLPIIQSLQEKFGISFDNMDLAMHSPQMLYRHIKKELSNGISENRFGS